MDGKIQVFEIQQTEVRRKLFLNKIFGSILEITQFFCHQVVGMEEGESDYSVVHLGPETQGLPAFHRIVGEDEVTGISISSFD